MLLLEALRHHMPILRMYGIKCPIRRYLCIKTLPKHHVRNNRASLRLVGYRWFYHQVVLRPIANQAQRCSIVSNVMVWKIRDTQVSSNRPLEPVGILPHDLQVFHSKRKGSVDGTVQSRASVHSPTSLSDWESKAVTQKLKNIVPNPFLSRRGVFVRTLFEVKMEHSSILWTRIVKSKRSRVGS